MILYIIIGIAVLVLLYVLVTYNQLIKHNNAVREAFSTMDVYMKKRWDLIPNIVATVKAHTAYEKDALEKIAALRSGTYGSLSQNDKLLINDKLSENISSLMLVAEGYPVLKSDQSFLEVAEKPQLEALVMKEPSYFFDILPYTYVLGVYDIWVKKFKFIALSKPDWYTSSSPFTNRSFKSFTDKTMLSVSEAMCSSPSSGGSRVRSGGGSSGGGSGGGGGRSGGGSSGGGSGGGGGSSW